MTKESFVHLAESIFRDDSPERRKEQLGNLFDIVEAQSKKESAELALSIVLRYEEVIADLKDNQQ